MNKSQNNLDIPWIDVGLTSQKISELHKILRDYEVSSITIAIDGEDDAERQRQIKNVMDALDKKTHYIARWFFNHQAEKPYFLVIPTPKVVRISFADIWGICAEDGANMQACLTLALQNAREMFETPYFLLLSGAQGQEVHEWVMTALRHMRGKSVQSFEVLPASTEHSENAVRLRLSDIPDFTLPGTPNTKPQKRALRPNNKSNP